MGAINISVITSLYRCEAFLELYLFFYGRVVNREECELILVHNDPTPAELAILDRFASPKMNIVHLKVKREGLYASWNRAIQVASGKYLAIWNVDDIRTPESLLFQKQALDNNNKAVLCYGDFYGTRKYGTYKEKYYQYETYDLCRKEALRRHIIGCFPMWRKDLHDRVGYFDEQFRLVSDYEFQLRVASTYPLVKANAVLGYYLEDAGHKLSSNRKLQQKERTAVDVRYRVYDRVLIHLLPSIVKYRIKKILNYGLWINISEIVPGLSTFRFREGLSLLWMPFSYTWWFIKRSFHRMNRIVTQ